MHYYEEGGFEVQRPIDGLDDCGWGTSKAARSDVGDYCEFLRDWKVLHRVRLEAACASIHYLARPAS